MGNKSRRENVFKVKPKDLSYFVLLSEYFQNSTSYFTSSGDLPVILGQND